METERIYTLYNTVGGEKRVSSNGKIIESIDPSTGKVWAHIPDSTENDAQEAVECARNAFPAWSSLPAMERSAYLRKIGDHLAQFEDELSQLETRDNGWVIRETKYGLMPVLASIWYEAAGACSVAGKGETVQLGKQTVGYTRREPLGVVVGIIPWNAPLFTFTIKAAAALAAGNTVVIKPSEHAGVSSLRYGEIVNEILPPGVLNTVSGDGAAVGETLVSHPSVKKVSLTGSGNTARAIARSTANDPKPMVLELGGKSPNIVFADADLKKAANGITVNGIFTGNAGQICVGGSRILIERPIFEDMLALMKQEIEEQIKLGATTDFTTSMGPIANAQQYEKVRAYIREGLDEGGEIVFGGMSGGSALLPGHRELHGGYWVEPTLMRVDTHALHVCQEEIFGPVAIVMPFDTEEEAFALANDTSYGLGAGVWTSSLERAHRFIQEVESGSVWVNTYRRVGPELPFGGHKQSGFGTDSVMEFTKEKTCYIEIG
ncbi:aldehyde dehydrogenase family protein [Bacillus sp. 1P06AnD]|uniref:aldehyde dehydrogenase family protein n=1 Tax=Bacillus sp. 1P06AnD TaxID=3132208 RepID=UPI0039A26797